MAILQEAPAPAPAARRTIIVTGAHGFSARTQHERQADREWVHWAVMSALKAAGVPPEDYDWHDEGEVMLVMLPPGAPGTHMISAFSSHLSEALRARNRESGQQQGIRLQVAVDGGPVTATATGFTGSPLVVACRLLNALPLREAMEATSADLGLITSETFFRNVVQPAPSSGQDLYRPVQVKAALKGFEEAARIHVTGDLAPAPRSEADHRSPPVVSGQQENPLDERSTYRAYADRAWSLLGQTLASRLNLADKADHLICAIETSGEPGQVRKRINQVRQIITPAVGETPKTRRVSLIAYGGHAIRRQEREQGVEVVCWNSTPAEALSGLGSLDEKGSADVFYWRASQIEDMLATVARQLQERTGQGQHQPTPQTVLLTVGDRPPHPHRVDPITQLIPCPHRYSWEELLGQLRSRGITFCAIRDPQPSTGTGLQPSAGPDFEEFYRQNFRLVRNVINTRTQDLTLAAGVTDEAMAIAYRKWDDLTDHPNPVGFVIVVARHILSRLQRQRATRDRPLQILSLDVNPGLEFRAASDPADDVTTRIALGQALRDLPAGQRECFVLYEILGHPIHTIAELLDLPEGTVKTRLRAARWALRKLLSDDLGEGTAR